MNEKILPVLQFNAEKVAELISSLSAYSKPPIEHLIASFDLSILSLLHADLLTLDEANFIQQQYIECITYHVHNKWNKELTFIAELENPEL